ncbi:YaaC family protein [Seinonella peptonophila]|uniref:YaaC family protein n=1 Tax=Seinonella peptonophila TaxID=112248 RepID=UPI001587BC15|nr:YaaC family protein [Seinonella peptonophila]
MKGPLPLFTPLQIIDVEHPETWLWEQLTYLENEYLAKPFLTKRYQHFGFEEVEKLSFHNVQAFSHYLRQGRACLQTTSALEGWVEPLTLYYGMLNLLKAVLITFDPTYPALTSLMRHGCSTRKKKRQPYRFLQDEVRIQKEGLLPHLLHFLTSSSKEGERFTPQSLFGMVPELQTPYSLITKKKTLFPIHLHQEHDSIWLIVSEDVLDQVHLSLQSWLHQFSRYVSEENKPKQSFQKNKKIYIQWSFTNIQEAKVWSMDHPWIYRNQKGVHYLWIDNERPYRDSLPMIAVIYLVLFSLSMLARYDSPLWGELLLDSPESALIQPLFQWVKRWLPHWVYDHLYNHHTLLQIN